MTAVRMKPPRHFWADGDGNPGAGWKLYFYTTGTSTPKNTYSESTLSSANANPVVASADGSWGEIFLNGVGYKVVLKDENDVLIWTADPYDVDDNIDRLVELAVTAPGTTISTGDGKAYHRTNVLINGWRLSAVAASVFTVSSSGTPTIQIRNVTQSVDMLTTRITIDANEKDSSTAATPAVIDTNNDTVTTGDQIAVDIDVAGTGTAGLNVQLTFSPT